jgi:hypothetical protein
MQKVNDILHTYFIEIHTCKYINIFTNFKFIQLILIKNTHY